MSGQLGLDPPASLNPTWPGDREPTGRERVLASTIAGFVFPGAGTFDNLRKAKREACLTAARLALETAEAAARTDA